jgi:pSer/pThr/pTyr-binding forkhead associated (FHA) protein
MKREVQIKLKAVSADHCNLSYGPEKGWTISEKGKDKLSSNGTFVFMKSHG